MRFTVMQENINTALKDHQLTIEDWPLADKISTLHRFTELMVLKFKLQLDEIPAITIKRLRAKSLGHYMPGRNGFGLKHELAIGVKHFNNDQFGDVLGTLLHKLNYFEQDILGIAGSTKNNYHNGTFQERSASFGLIVNSRGNQHYSPPTTMFSEFLSEHGVPFPHDLVADDKCDESPEESPALAGSSKLKLWECQCTPKPVKARVAIADFQAICLKCDKRFIKKE